MKKRKFLPVLLLTSTLVFGATANAADCPACEAAGVHNQMYTQGTQLWNQSNYHIKEYSEGGVLYRDNCFKTVAEERIDWLCPVGHGIITSKIHHTEFHTSTHCTDLDYYY